MQKPSQFCIGSVLLVLFALASIASSQKPTPTPERNREIVALLNDARYAAPELAVDTFLRVLETKKVTDPVWRKEIIEEAMRTIDEVQYAMPMRLAFGGQNQLNDTEDYMLASAFRLKLDRLSLKGRAITLLLETDPTRAKLMIFQMGGDFRLKARSCENATTYSLDDIYSVVAKVATAVFTEKQVAEGHRALFVAPWIENIDSPTQIYPALDLVKHLQGSQVERQILFGAMSKAINRDFRDDRSFTNSINWGSIGAKIDKLTSSQDMLKTDLLYAYRSLLLKNLRGARCTDNEIKKDKPIPDYIESVNKLVPDKPLTLEDVVASEVTETAKVSHLLTKSPTAKKLRDEYIAVQGITVVDNKLVKHDQTDAAWISSLNAFIDKLLSYEGSDGETESELLFLKSSCLQAMVFQAVDAGDLRKSIVRRYLRLLASSPLQKTSFLQWVFWMRGMESTDRELFAEIASEFPNPNLKAMVAASRLLDEAKKEEPKPTPTPVPTSKP